MRENDDKPIALDWEIVPPEHRDSAIREFLNRPNPMRHPTGEAAFWIIWIAISVGVALAQWAARA